jgi:ABC-type multidrug transport system fused ATPase/permease subunit
MGCKVVSGVDVLRDAYQHDAGTQERRNAGTQTNNKKMMLVHTPPRVLTSMRCLLSRPCMVRSFRRSCSPSILLYLFLSFFPFFCLFSLSILRTKVFSCGSFSPSLEEMWLIHLFTFYGLFSLSFSYFYLFLSYTLQANTSVRGIKKTAGDLKKGDFIEHKGKSSFQKGRERGERREIGDRGDRGDRGKRERGERGR